MMSLPEWYQRNAARAAVKFGTMKTRVRRGMSLEQALVTPPAETRDTFARFWRQHADRAAVSREVARCRYRRGWEIEDAITVPAGEISELTAFWRENRARAGDGLTYEMFRTRVRRRWDLEDALVTPRQKDWGVLKRRVLEAITAQPGITRRELGAEYRSNGSLSRALGLLIDDAQVRHETDRAGGRWVTRYFPMPAAEIPRVRAQHAAEELEDDGWEPRPYVTAIRARALGIAG
jgi:hypothetical protein